MYDDGDYGGIDEFMYWMTQVIIVLITTVFLLVLVGFMCWDMI